MSDVINPFDTVFRNVGDMGGRPSRRSRISPGRRN